MIPIADDLVPFLIAALERSTSNLVFPKPDGSMYTNDLDLVGMLRRALVKAGVITHYKVRCLAKRCGYKATSSTAVLGTCPKCNRGRLKSTGVSRAIRFHDTRHTTTTLLLKTGVPSAVVQKVVRHKDPRVTLQIYGHLDTEDMKMGVNALDLGLSGVQPVRHRCPSPVRRPLSFQNFKILVHPWSQVRHQARFSQRRSPRSGWISPTTPRASISRGDRI
jgi:integrase